MGRNLWGELSEEVSKGGRYSIYMHNDEKDDGQ